MKLILVLCLLILTSVLEAKKPSKAKSSKYSDLMRNFSQFLYGNLILLIVTATFLSVIVYLIYDYIQKKKIYELLEAIKQATPQPTGSVISPSRQTRQPSAQPETRSNTEFPIYKVVITGGPCGGKTTGLDRIKKEMTQKGFRVYSIPEIPTVVFNAGGMILMSKFSTQEKIRFQSLLIKYQIYTEDYFTKLAEMSKSPSIIICDR